MKITMQKIHHRYAALSLRERVLVVISLWVFVSVVWFNLVSDPMYAKSRQAENNVTNSKTQLLALEQQYNKLLQTREQDPLREARNRIEQLQVHINRLDQQLKEKLHGLITPKQMVKVLESVLQKNTSLKLIRIKSVKAEPLLAETDKKGNEPDDNEVNIYRHGLDIEFEGNYLAALEYLKALEGLSWEFYWDEVQLDVQKYPVSRITVRVHTLSLGQSWIGV